VGGRGLDGKGWWGGGSVGAAFFALPKGQTSASKKLSDNLELNWRRSAGTPNILGKKIKSKMGSFQQGLKNSVSLFSTC